MEFIPCNCPKCGGALQIPDNKDFVKCMYCGGDIKVRDVITITNLNEKNIREIASAAYEAGNFSDSYIQYGRLLEIDPTNPEYWLYKAYSAGWLSNLNKDGFDEMTNYISKGLSLVSDDNIKEVYKIEAAQQSLLLAHAYFNLSTQHTIEFISLPSAIYENIARCRRLIGFLDKSHSLSPDMTEINDLIVEIATRQYKASESTDSDKSFFKNYALKYKHNGTPPEKLKRLNDSSCFVVTATMGNEENIVVYNLREFRDQYLLKTATGKTFVNWYYKKGPKIAKAISVRTYRRAIALLVVVLPAFIITLPFIYFIEKKNQRAQRE